MKVEIWRVTMHNGGTMVDPAEISIEITKAAPALAPLRDFYAACGYPGPTKPDDDVVLAKQDGKIVGAVRLVVEQGCHLLRGMYIDEALQRRGIGKRLLDRFERLLDARPASEAYLTCGPHLEEFYGRIGFRRAGPSVSPPAFLVTRRDGYSSRFGPQIIMYRIMPGSIRALSGSPS